MSLSSHAHCPDKALVFVLGLMNWSASIQREGGREIEERSREKNKETSSCLEAQVHAKVSDVGEGPCLGLGPGRGCGGWNREGDCRERDKKSQRQGVRHRSQQEGPAESGPKYKR